MISINLKGQSVLITGGTKGIGYASALMYGEAGAQVYLTYKWGSADMENLMAEFSKRGALPPIIIQADVSLDEDTDRLLEEIAKTSSKVDIFISNVGFALTTRSLDEYKKRSLFKTFEYSSWPMVEYTRRIHKKFGSYPKYILGISSDGPDHFYPGYDFVAASKSLLEFFAKYLAARLFSEGSRVNVVRFGNVKTESFEMIFGDAFFNYLKEQGVPASAILEPEDCAKTVFALTSGLFDSVTGQIITADNGLSFKDNAMMHFQMSQKGAKI